MTVNRTTLLDLPLPVTGTESGTWGDTTNNGLTQYLDIAIAGTLVLSTDADVTLTSTEGDSSATNIGATTAQYAILRWTATGSTTRNITALAQSKTYVVINATGGTQSIVLRGAGPTTGVTIISGEKAFCVWNGSDFVKVSSSAAAGGSNTQVQYNSSGVLAGSSNMTFNGTKLTVAGFLDSALTSGRVPYATTSGELTDSANLLYSGTDLNVYGITVGRGAGAVSTNTAVGASALAAGPSGRAVAIGYQALTATTADSNTAVGYQAGYTNTTGYYLVAMGREALYSNTSGISNVGIGDYALQANTTASNNTAVGYQALYASNRTADANGYNTAIGYGSGSAITTGQKNTILGRYSGNQGGLDIRTASNYVVLSDGDGNPLVSTADNQTVALEGAVPNSGTGITFPATQSASSNANTLDDYEEGTWTATLTDGTNTVTSDGATYRKIGSLVFVSFQFYNKNISAWNAANLSVTGLPFTVATNHDSFITVGTPNGFTVSGPLTMSFGNGSTSSGLYYRGGSSNWAAVQKGDITNNANFSLYLSACYTAS